MALFLALRPFLPYFLKLTLILGMGCWIYDLGHRKGADVTTIAYETKIRKELERIQTANDEALANARRIEAELRAQVGARNEAIQSLRDKALSDLDALGICIFGDGVSDIDSIN